jgi:molybdopterin converting factor small subunit
MTLWRPNISSIARDEIKNTLHSTVNPLKNHISNLHEDYSVQFGDKFSSMGKKRITKYKDHHLNDGDGVSSFAY